MSFYTMTDKKLISSPYLKIRISSLSIMFTPVKTMFYKTARVQLWHAFLSVFDTFDLYTRFKSSPIGKPK